MPVALTDSRANPTKLSPRARRKGMRENLAALTPDIFRRALWLSRSRETAQDLVQDTVERALRFEERFRPDSNLRGWVYQILFNVFMTRCRRFRRESNALSTLYSDPCEWTTRDGDAEMLGLSAPIARALDKVPETFRTAVILVDLREMSYKTAAQRLHVPVGTVMSRVHRGRQALAEAVLAAGASAARRRRLKVAVFRSAAAPRPLVQPLPPPPEAAPRSGAALERSARLPPPARTRAGAASLPARG